MSDIYSQDLTPSLDYENTYKSGQMIYLYVKTHNVTGLKYLGKTVSKDPHKYKGSGVVWRNHCNVHGYDYSTQIIFQSIHKDEIKQRGIYYSQLWNVVTSDEWANIKQEECDGGYCASSFTPEANAKRSQTMKGRPQHPDHTAKVSKALKGRKDTRSPEAKAQAAAKASLKLKGRKMSEESKQKRRDKRIGKPLPEATKLNLKASWTAERRAAQAERTRKQHTIKLQCPHCGVVGTKLTMKKSHFNRCVEVTGIFKYVFTSPCGEQHKVNDITQFCTQVGLNRSSVFTYIREGKTLYKGWTIQKLG